MQGISTLKKLRMFLDVYNMVSFEINDDHASYNHYKVCNPVFYIHSITNKFSNLSTQKLPDLQVKPQQVSLTVFV